MAKEINKNKIVDTKNTIQTRIDAGWHRTLKTDAAKARTSIRELVEACLADSYQKIKEDYGLDK